MKQRPKMTPEERRTRRAARQMVWCRANPEINKARKAAWYVKYKEKIKAGRAAYKRAYSLKNKAKISASSAARYVKQRLKINAYNTAYRRANPEKFSTFKNLRRAMVLGATVGDVSVIEKWEAGVRKKKRVICYWCRKPFPGRLSHVDHIQALSNGGAHSIGNLCLSCPSCNCRKNAKPVAVWNQIIDEPVLL